MWWVECSCWERWARELRIRSCKRVGSPEAGRRGSPPADDTLDWHWTRARGEGSVRPFRSQQPASLSETRPAVVGLSRGDPGRAQMTLLSRPGFATDSLNAAERLTFRSVTKGRYTRASTAAGRFGAHQCYLPVRKRDRFPTLSCTSRIEPPAAFVSRRR
jgi:hypothetical protein